MTESFSGYSLNSLYALEPDSPSPIYLGQLQGSITGIQWYPDESSLLIVMEGRQSPGDIHAWRAEFRPLPRMEPILGPGGYPIAFSPDGSFLAFERDGTKVLRDLHSGEDRALPIRFVFDSLVWLPDSSGFLAFDFDKEASAYRLLVFQLSQWEAHPLSESALNVVTGWRNTWAFSPDRTRFAYVAGEMYEAAGVDLLTFCRL